MNEKPLVSICCITYNHGQYIKQALEGFLMQNTRFPIEIIINDDASSDGTTQIIQEYVKKYPKIIKPVYHEENEYSRGLRAIAVRNTFPLAKGKYIALCEGDDYWTDQNKLQKQVDFLEVNNDFTICFHNAEVLKEGEKLGLSKLKSYDKEHVYTIEDLAEYNFIHTGSVVFRNGLVKNFPDWFTKSPAGDYPLHMLNASHGKIKYFPEPMMVYRKHEGGVWSSMSPPVQLGKSIVVIDFLIAEFTNNVTVVEKLRKQKLVILNEIVGFYLSNHLVEEAKRFMLENAEANKEFLPYWVNNGFGVWMGSVKHRDNRLKSILESTTYRLLKKIKVFK